MRCFFAAILLLVLPSVSLGQNDVDFANLFRLAQEIRDKQLMIEAQLVELDARVAALEQEKKNGPPVKNVYSAPANGVHGSQQMPDDPSDVWKVQEKIGGVPMAQAAKNMDKTGTIYPKGANNPQAKKQQDVPGPGLAHIDPAPGTSALGYRYVTHPQTGLIVPVRNEWHSYINPGGRARIIELVRYNGRPVVLQSAIYGMAGEGMPQPPQVQQQSQQQQGGGNP